MKNDYLNQKLAALFVHYFLGGPSPTPGHPSNRSIWNDQGPWK